MALIKPTLEICIDAKAHAWMVVSEEKDAEGNDTQHIYCQKCGVLTQLVYNEQGEPLAMVNPDGTPYMIVPKVLLMAVG